MILKKNFKGAATIEELTELFKELAPAFLYCGHIRVGEDYRIYIHTVEFYFHAENGSPYDIQDPIAKTSSSITIGMRRSSSSTF